MKLIAGLGNPGDKYKKTRHNLGSRVINIFVSKYKLESLKIEKKFKSNISINTFKDEKTILCQPQTFMNNSGQSIKALADYYKIPSQDILIIHDDIDLELGQVKLQKNRGSAGHKGVRSVIDALQTKDFLRIRMGIASANQPEINTEEFVLKNFSPAEEQIIYQSIKKAAELIAEAF